MAKNGLQGSYKCSLSNSLLVCLTIKTSEGMIKLMFLKMHKTVPMLDFNELLLIEGVLLLCDVHEI